MTVITRLKKRIVSLQQVAECEKFVDNSWVRLWSEVAYDICGGDGAVGASVGDGAAGAGSGDGAAGAGSGDGAAWAGSGDGAAGAGSGAGAAGACSVACAACAGSHEGTAMEIGRNEVW